MSVCPAPLHIDKHWVERIRVRLLSEIGSYFFLYFRFFSPSTNPTNTKSNQKIVCYCSREKDHFQPIITDRCSSYIHTHTHLYIYRGPFNTHDGKTKLDEQRAAQLVRGEELTKRKRNIKRETKPKNCDTAHGIIVMTNFVYYFY